MTTGEGIFYGFVFLGLIWLYIATRDRWKWKRIWAWVVAAAAVPLLGIGVWALVDDYRNSLPQIQTAFWGISPGISQSDVIFTKGKPDTEDGTFWTYGTNPANAVYQIQMRKGKVRVVAAFANNSSSLPSIQGISGYSTIADIEKKFGPPDHIAESKDKTTRMLSYLKFRVFFSLSKGSVEGLGAIDPSEGPLLFAD